MKTIQNRKYVFFCLITAIIISFIAVTFYQLGFRINATESVAGIIWQIENKPHNFNKGDYIVVCPPPEFMTKHKIAQHLEIGNCAGKKPLLKQIIGIEGDHVLINNNGVHINGKFIRNTKPILKQHQNINQTIPLNQFIIAGETSNSMDSRYFGPIKKQWIVGKVNLIY